MTIETLRTHRATSARWEDALDAQLEAYLFATSDRGQRYLRGWQASAADKMKFWSPFISKATESIAAGLFNAEPIHVDPDMMTLWEAACDGFEEEPLQESDLLTTSGFVWLPRPHTITDAHGKNITHRAFLWHPVESEDARDPGAGRRYGVALYLFHRLGDPDDWDIDYLKTGSWGSASLRTGDLILDHVYPWMFGTPPPPKPPLGKPATHDLQVLLRLLQQTIVTHAPGRPTRPVRRRCKRYEFPERNVVVVRLRRPTTPTGDESEPRPVEWSHRWLVGGHWRNQWFPSLGVHRQVFISPYVKGPSDKPLIPRKTRIFDWSR